jgi:hypothetical protein
MGFIFSIAEGAMEGVVIPAIVVSDVVGKIVLCRNLERDPSTCSSHSMESVLGVIATLVRATTLVAAAPAPPCENK